MTKHSITWPKAAFARRSVLKMAGAAGALAATMPLSRAIWAQEGKVIKARAYADIDKFDPGFYQNAYNVDVMNCIYSKLTTYKPGDEWEWQLQAAESVEEVDPTHIRFKLQKGIEFTNDFGELTAHDVKFSFERVIKFDSPVKGDWGTLSHVDVEDDYTGVIVFKEPFPPAWNIALPYGVGCIVSKKGVESLGGEGGDFNLEPPCFSGPYVLEEWRPKEVTILTRNPIWKGPKPGFDEIRVYPIDDEHTAEIAYEAGDIDFTNVSLASVSQLKSNPPPDTTLEDHPSLYYVWVGMNKDHPNLSEINVRKAVQWGINVPQIMEAAYFGEAAPATGLIAPGLTGHREKSLVPPEGDPAKAQEYLDQAGVGNLDLTLDVLNATTWTTTAQVIQANLAEIGINVTVNVHDSGSFWTLGMEDEGDRWKNMQLVLNRFSMLPDPYYATSWFTCDQVGIWNWERFCSERFDELNRMAATETDTEKRGQMYSEMQDIMEESGQYRFLTHEAWPVLYRNTVMKPATRPDGRPLFRFFKTV